MAERPTLCALLVVHNEEEVIEDALKSVTFCDEIIVVLDKCTDGTKKIAEKYATKLIEGAWEIEGERRNLGIEACPEGWILEIDADERIAKPLKEEILKVLPTAPDGQYLLPVQNYIGKRYVKHGWAGVFGTTKAKKFFKKGCKWWGMERAHAPNKLQGKTMEFNREFAEGEGLVHLLDKDLDDMTDRLQRYSSWMAQDLRDKVARGEREFPPLRNTIRRALTRFYKSYWHRKGYKEGKMGFHIAVMSALLIIFTDMKAQLENE